PLMVYAALTLVSSALSINPRESFIDSRQLLLFLMVPVVARFARGDRADWAINVIIALGAAGAVVGIVQFAMFGYDNLNNRPVGTLSHYMTYSGVLMLVTGAAVSRLLFHRGEWIWPAIAVPALLVALVATFARNAWVGAFVAVVCLLALRNWKLVIIAPVVAVLLFALAPASIRQRAFSMFDLNDLSNRDRRAMLKVGAGMIQDHPFFGVGPEQIEDLYPRYRPPDAVNPTNPHLHNVPVQIAAERGLPALLVWIWFVVVALRDLVRQLRQGPAKSVAAAGLAAVIGMLAAGLFEYNFGDSEFLMLFLGLITLPYAAARAPAVAAGFDVPSPAPARARATAS
ncbi:MAG TPA: O-antigen ligase family protein, partial [Vicinamibacterales bacterium]